MKGYYITMVFWTLQSKKVIDIAKKNGVYYPDFSFSPKQHKEDYARVLSAFNKINKTDYKGLIFCLGPEIFLHGSNSFHNKEEVQNLLRGNPNISNSFAYKPYLLFNKEHILIKIEDSEFDQINTIPIDYWNHIIVMDGGSPEYFDSICAESAYHNLEYNDFQDLIFESICMGQYIRPIMETSRINPCKTMTEIHIPYIKYSAITETFEASELFLSIKN